MRKITRRACGDFLAHRESTRTSDNTESFADRLFLHGHQIAEWREGGEVWVSLSGWPTPTTRERINGIARLTDDKPRPHGVYQEGWLQYACLGDDSWPIGSTEWWPIHPASAMRAYFGNRDAA